jgi:hypothetical protein
MAVEATGSMVRDKSVDDEVGRGLHALFELMDKSKENPKGDAARRRAGGARTRDDAREGAGSNAADAADNEGGGDGDDVSKR